MCGEKLSAVFTSCINLGSPPRVRGKELIAELANFRLGITPACAGKRAESIYDVCAVRDHPRVCGEKGDKYMIFPPLMGSPPRVRGKD